MKSMIKSLLYGIRPFLLAILAFFFPKEYLQGRYFETGFVGIFWAFRSIWMKNILRLGLPMPWPTGLTCRISSAENIKFHVDDLNNFQSPGTFFQNFNGVIWIGKGSYIGPNVGIITANHEFNNLAKHSTSKDVVIGENCWIGMNSVILPGVVLGGRTVVGAGSVVTKSFLEGNVVLGGVPARILKKIENESTASQISDT